MKTILEFFSSDWAQALGWTLLHTVWQAGILTVLVIITLRLIPSRLARVRYCIATSALALMIVLSIGTFVFLTTSTHQSEVIAVQNSSVNNFIAPQEEALTKSPANNYFLQAQLYLQSYMPFIIVLWIIGAFAFSIRVAGGWFYLIKIKQVSTLLDDDWSARVNMLARQLKINRIVSLATSPLIQAPIVFGYLKPIILIPTGMLTGLSAEQLETIFIHELTHIRRHDYIINLFQLWVEALLFFNPFAWILSGIIRREREYCCDDAVVTTYGNALAYAQALAHLEEVRLTQPGLALSLAENKNQLLNRIKRIMEKSVKNYSGRERIVPAVLLVVGLLCASWLTLSVNRTGKDFSSDNLAAADTTIKKSKSAKYSRKSTTSINEVGEPVEKVEETFDGDEELRPMMEPSFDMDFDESFAMAPPLPDFEMALAPLAFNFQLDSIPMPAIANQNWEQFAEAFEKRFKENFSDFYSSHQKDFDKMMSDMEKEFKPMDHEVWAKHFLEDIERAEARARHLSDNEVQQLQEEAMRHHEEARLHQQAALERAREIQVAHEKDRERWEKEHQQHMKKVEEKMKEAEEQMKKVEENMKRFEKELKVELVRDGYIKKDEKINNLQWDDNGDIEVNGKEIKESDKAKYNDLHRKFFKEHGGHFRYVE